MHAQPPTSGARRVATNAALLAGSTLLARLAMFALGVVLARTLGAEDFGRYGLGVALAAVVLPLTDLGVSQYLAREVARSTQQGEAQVVALARVRLLSALGVNAVAMLLVVVLVVDERTQTTVLLALCAAALDGLAQFAFGYFQGLERMRLQANLTTLVSLARATGGITIALATGSLMAVLVWSIGIGLAQALFSGDRMRRVVRGAAAARRSPVWGTVIAIGAVTIFVNLTLRADTLLIGALRSEAEVGYYTAAWALLGGLQVVPWMIAVALGPVFARTHATDPAAFRRAWNEGMRTVILLSVPVAVLVSILASPIVGRLFGAEYAPGETALAILVWSVPLAGLNSVATLALRGAGRERILVAVMATGAAVNIGVNQWAIREHGIDGAAVVNVGTELVILALLTTLVVRVGLAPLPRVALPRLVLALAVLAGLAVLLRDRVPVEVALAVPALAYAGVAWATRLVSREDLAQLRRSS